MRAVDAQPFRAEPFKIAVDPGVIDDVRARTRPARLPETAPGEPWAQGTDRDWLAGLLGYWAGEFDWPSVQRYLNVFAHFRARVGETMVHFVHERARHGGGDFGSGIATFMALDDPAPLTGLHLTNVDRAGRLGQRDAVGRPGDRACWVSPARVRHPASVGSVGLASSLMS